MSQRIWTIGHSTHAIETFIALLEQHDIQLLADVRTFPASRRMPWFNKEPLAEQCAGRGIGYAHLPDLGGRRKPRADSRNTAWRNDGFRGYADHMATAAFLQVLAALKEMAAAHRTAIMCAEALWWQCHRSLIADRLKADGWQVVHILTGKVEEHPYTKAARLVNGELDYSADVLM